MKLVVTLIAPIAGPDFEREPIDRLARAIADIGGQAGAIDWLDPGRACDLHFEAAALTEARAGIAETLAGLALDHYVQPVAGRKKRLLISDMDSTILAGETLDDLSPFTGDNRAAIDRLTQQSVTGAMSFSDSLIRRVELMAGLGEDAFAAAYARQRLNPGAAELIAGCRRLGIETALISGGFEYFTTRVAERLGFDIAIANRLELGSDNRLTGRLIPPIIDPDGEFGKLGRLRQLAAARGLDSSAIAAIGDGANDIPMLAEAGLGCAWRAKPRVRAAIACRLDHADLTGLLYFMGYARRDFRSAETITPPPA